jgi:uncharacterized phage protein (TIGR02220 family)
MKTTICEICNHFSIKQFNQVYELLNNLNINPLNISKTELSLLLFNEIKRFDNLNNLQVISKTEYNKDNNSYKTIFLNKHIIIKKDNEKNSQENKDEYEDEINLILSSLNSIREDIFKVKKSNFKSNDVNKKLIKKWLKKGYKVEDFINVHNYTANNYKLHSDEKINKGFYFKPTTIYNNKFESRVEESENIGIQKLNNISVEEMDELIEIVKKINDIRENKFNLNTSYELNKSTKKMIIEVLKDYTKDEIFNMFEYITDLYLKNENKDVRNGIYFRPSTLFNDKFEARMENSKNFINEKSKEEKEEEKLIEKLLKSGKF